MLARLIFCFGEGNFFCILMNVAVRSMKSGFAIFHNVIGSFSCVFSRNSIFQIRLAILCRLIRRIDIITEKRRHEWLIQRVEPDNALNIVILAASSLPPFRVDILCRFAALFFVNLLILHDRYLRSLKHVIKLNFPPIRVKREGKVSEQNKLKKWRNVMV